MRISEGRGMPDPYVITLEGVSENKAIQSLTFEGNSNKIAAILQKGLITALRKSNSASLIS